MNWLTTNIKGFLVEEDGVTAIEYGLIAALVALGIIVGAGMLGVSLDTIFQNISGILDAAPTTP